MNFRFDAFRGIFDSLFSRQQSIQNKTNKSDFRTSSFSEFFFRFFFVLIGSNPWFCVSEIPFIAIFWDLDRKLRVSRSWTMTVENLGRDLGWSKNVLPYSNWLLLYADGPDVAFATNFRAKWHNFHRFLFFWYAIIRQKVIILVCYYYFTFLILVEDFLLKYSLNFPISIAQEKLGENSPNLSELQNAIWM